MKPLLPLWIAPLVALALPMSQAAAYDRLAASVDETGTRLVLLDRNNQVMPAINPMGYNVVTWDPRGEWNSGGVLHLDFPDFDGLHVFGPDFIENYFSFITRSDDDFPPVPTGSQIWMTMDLISAPEGGEFAFWELNAQAPTHVLPSDGSGGSYSFVLSEWDAGVPDAAQDPEGHIEGRVFTATLPGDYYISFKLYDSQGQLAPSEDYTFHFAAVPEPGTLSLGLTALAALGLRRRGRV